MFIIYQRKKNEEISANHTTAVQRVMRGVGSTLRTIHEVEGENLPALCNSSQRGERNHEVCSCRAQAFPKTREQSFLVISLVVELQKT